ncbi:MAG: hypothetical protein DRP62_07120 [Planctomycetota bacterium]|nr:MAG: hypothetical protein DRP62_07120 [Planctomycetota bacterium]
MSFVKARKTENIATKLFEIVIHRTYKNTNTVLAAIDDSPTPIYGPKVSGAGIHRNPTPTPEGRKSRISKISLFTILFSIVFVATGLEMRSNSSR